MNGSKADRERQDLSLSFSVTRRRSRHGGIFPSIARPGQGRTRIFDNYGCVLPASSGLGCEIARRRRRTAGHARRALERDDFFECHPLYLFSEHDLFGKRHPFSGSCSSACLSVILYATSSKQKQGASCRPQLKTNAQHSGRCMSPVVSRFQPWDVAARWRCSIWIQGALRPQCGLCMVDWKGRQSGHVDDVARISRAVRGGRSRSTPISKAALP